MNKKKTTQNQFVYYSLFQLAFKKVTHKEKRMNNTKRYIIDEIAGIKTIRKHKYRSSADDKKGQVRECFSLLVPQPTIRCKICIFNNETE